MPVSFVTMTNKRHAEHVLRMMRELYESDAPDLQVNVALMLLEIARDVLTRRLGAGEAAPGWNSRAAAVWRGERKRGSC